MFISSISNPWFQHAFGNYDQHLPLIGYGKLHNNLVTSTMTLFKFILPIHKMALDLKSRMSIKNKRVTIAIDGWTSPRHYKYINYFFEVCHFTKL